MNSLDMGGPPPAPDIAAAPAQPGNALAMSGNPGGPPGQGAAAAGPVPTPTPTHEQTVAALRHFQAIQDELEPLLKDPDLGKSDLKSKVIDGATRLVATRIFSPAEAVGQLAEFPEKPFDQRNWIIRNYFMAHVAMMQVLDHHGAAAAAKMVPEGGKPDQGRHMEDMKGLVEHYKPQAGGQ